MSVESSHIVKALTSYMHRYPAETMALMPLYDATRDHVRQGKCRHNRRCPVVTAGAVLVDEQERALTLRHGDRWALGEGTPESADDSLGEVAMRVLREYAGVHDAWTLPGGEDPFVIDVTTVPHDGHRLGVGFRYLYRTHSSTVPSAVLEAGRAVWQPLARICLPQVVARVRSCMAALQ